MQNGTIPIGSVTEARVMQNKPEGKEFTYVDIGSIDRETKRIADAKTLPTSKAPSRARQQLKTGDVLVSMTRPNLNAVAMVPEDLDGSTGSTGFHVLRARDAEPGFLFYAVQSPEFISAMCQKVQGALYPAVRPRDISSFCLPNFSLDAQRATVAEIEKQFTRLEAGVSALRRVRANLKRHRKSYLNGISKGPWPFLRIEQIGETVTGSTPSTKDPLNFGGALPFFKPTDLNLGYRVEEAREHLSSKGAALARVLPEKAVLVTCIGATIGKTGLARVRCATNQQINALIPHDNIAIPEWLFWMLSSAQGQRQILENASATTLPILNKRRFQGLALPIPSLATQIELVTEIEKMVSIIDKTEANVTATLSRAERLRRSILQKAFSGAL